MLKVIKQHGTPFPIWISLLNANLAWYNRRSDESICQHQQDQKCNFVVLITWALAELLHGAGIQQEDILTAAVLLESDVDIREPSSVKRIVLHARTFSDGCSSANPSHHITSANKSFLICWTCGICGVISMTQDLQLWLYAERLLLQPWNTHTCSWPWNSVGRSGQIALFNYSGVNHHRFSQPKDSQKLSHYKKGSSRIRKKIWSTAERK